MKTWIRKGQNDFPFCRICNCELKAKAGIADLKAHAKTLKHIERAKAIEIQAGSSSVLVNASKFNDKVTNIELHLAAFCVEHNVPFSAMDHLVLMLQNTIQDSDLKKKTCAKTKATALVKNVIGETHQDELCGMLRTKYFSLC